MAVDYSTLKVPELKKMLQERSLPVTGNKLDLVNRLRENDKQAAPATAEEDEIDYSDDEPAPAKTTEEAKSATSKVAPIADEPAPAPAPASRAAEPTAPATEAAPEAVLGAEKTDEEHKEPEEAVEAATEAPKEDFALNLDATDAAAEAKKRADRAKRFGIDEDEETKKKAERAKRFGVEAGNIAFLDSALPERRHKRDRSERVEEQAGRHSKRQSTDGRDRRGRGNRNGYPGGRYNGGGDRDTRRSAAVDPSEKAKMDARAKRFSS